ncbi:MAG: EAL domain-containing protein [Thioalkalivibrionaceae bacterium]
MHVIVSATVKRVTPIHEISAPSSDADAFAGFGAGPEGEGSAVRWVGCRECLDAHPLGFPISMAFQPIVDLRDHSIWSYEALVRGADGASAASVLGRIDEVNRYYFDQTARVTAIRLATELGLAARLNINFLPNAVYRPETCIRATLQAAEMFGFDISRIVFEVTEGEQVRDRMHLRQIFDAYRERGFITAIDDFGEGHSGLNHLVELTPDVVKLDINLVRALESDRPRRLIVEAVARLCRELGIEVIAEGVETEAELRCLEDLGIVLFQGFLFARPGFECLPQPVFPPR